MSQDERIENQKFLEFSLNKEQFVIDILQVREVVTFPALTPLPNSPEHFLGIMNLRGEIISVIDLRSKLNIEKSADLQNSTVVIVEVDDKFCIGTVVDSVNQVSSFTAEENASVPQMSSQINSEYIKSIFKKDGELLVHIDIVSLLDERDKVQLTQSKVA